MISSSSQTYSDPDGHPAADAVHDEVVVIARLQRLNRAQLAGDEQPDDWADAWTPAPSTRMQRDRRDPAPLDALIRRTLRAAPGVEDDTIRDPYLLDEQDPELIIETAIARLDLWVDM